MLELTPALLEQLERRFPGTGSLLVVGDVPPPQFDTSFSGPRPARDVLELDFQERFDFGLFIGPTADDIPAIARLRDIGCRRVLLLVEADEWTENDLRGLGFLPTEPLESHDAFLYDSDLLNQPREWNNARHWANPENFDKYRW